MTVAPMRYCSCSPTCRVLVTSGRHPDHRKKERDRPNVDVRRLYRSARWAAIRQQKKDEQPFCVDCEAEGNLYVPWEDLDHEIPHGGDLALFWDYSNLTGRCHSHHSAKTGRGL